MKTKTNIIEILSVFLLTAVTLHSSIGQQPNRFFSSGDSIYVDVRPGNDMYYSHEVAKGTTLYSLAQTFDVNEQSIRIANQLKFKETLGLGEIVEVPLSKDKILLNKPKTAFLALWYSVKPKETLYSISKKFHLEIKSILGLNHKKTSELKVGENILLGYIVINNLVTEVQKKASETSNLANQTKNPNETVVSAFNPIKVVSEDIIAGWDKHSDNFSTFIVLHNKAKIGSIMEISYPMMGRKINAKVIGRIPYGPYKKEISMWVSPSTAKALGVLDNRFRVQVSYISD
ncbi:MAG: LysM peptidoglycan-binding domain-containing protein [Saprospiraceae bacterium]